MRVRVSAGCRLHFGLLSVLASEGRQFGGCGVVLDDVRVIVSAARANDWHAHGPCADRALAFAKMVTATPIAITVEACPPEHVGLGVGTQLGLCVARAVSKLLTNEDRPITELAKLVGRGQRSGIGLHGFAHGGWIVDGGRGGTELPTLLQQCPWPSAWRIVLIRCHERSRWHSDVERAAFARNRETTTATSISERLARILLMQLMPAIVEHDFASFAPALTEYNRLAGAHFAEDQGGVYASPAVAAIIEQVRAWGYEGVGQSSWGPTVFTCVPDMNHALMLQQLVESKFANDVVVQVVGGGSAADVCEI